MRIGIVLPGHPGHPAGGYKIIFEYTNKLINDGNEVVLIYQDHNALHKVRVPEFIKIILLKYLIKFEPNWFKLDKRVEKVTLKDKHALRKIGKLDIIIATAATTAQFVNNEFNNARKYYFIQDFENWTLTDEEVYNTYKYGFKNIVIAQWLKEIVEGCTGEKAICIKNPIDVNIYKPYTKIDKRDPFEIAMLYHSGQHKGCTYALAAIKKLKVKYPQIKLTMFGTAKLNEKLPDWITYYKDASQRQTVNIYNKASIFVCGTIQEGFGLTGLEAMACGDALVSTDYLGVKEYAKNGYDALLSPVKDVDSLYNNLIKVIEDKNLRLKIASNGIEKAKDFSIEESYKKLKKAISK